VNNKSFRFPIKIGFDLSGTVVAIGDAVKGLKVGEEVFRCLPLEDMGDLVLVFFRCVGIFGKGG
jgi:NADPH:quinone reductase-like Zn-dependent oxidoreductase